MRQVFVQPLNWALVAALVLSSCGAGPAIDNAPLTDPFNGADEYMSPPFIRGVAHDPQSGRTYFSICPEREYACTIFKTDSNARVATAISGEADAVMRLSWPSISPDGKRLLAIRSPTDLAPDQPTTIRQDLVEFDLASGDVTVLARHDGLLFRPTYVDQGLFAYFTSDRLAPVRGCTAACTQVPTSLTLVVGRRDRVLARIGGFHAEAGGGRLAHVGDDTLLVDAWSHADAPDERRLRALLVSSERPYFTEYATPAAALEATVQRRGDTAAWIGHSAKRASPRPTLTPFLDADTGLSFGANVDLLEDGRTVHIRKMSSTGRPSFRIVFRRMAETGWTSDHVQEVVLQ